MTSRAMWWRRSGRSCRSRCRSISRILRSTTGQTLALPYPILENIDPNLVARFEEQTTNPTNGVDLEIQSSRYYPLHNTAVHLLGHVQFDNEFGGRRGELFHVSTAGLSRRGGD